jgi:hypothetical protein
VFLLLTLADLFGLGDRMVAACRNEKPRRLLRASGARGALGREGWAGGIELDPQCVDGFLKV